jgi:hypothetical protein
LPSLSLQKDDINGLASHNLKSIEHIKNLMTNAVSSSRFHLNNSDKLPKRNKIIDPSFGRFRLHSSDDVDDGEKITVITLPRSAFNYN